MVATEMVRDGYRRAAIGALIMVACYLRPREAILLAAADCWSQRRIQKPLNAHTNKDCELDNCSAFDNTGPEGAALAPTLVDNPPGKRGV